MILDLKKTLDPAFNSLIYFDMFIYNDKFLLFLLLKKSGLGCHVGSTYTGAVGYADDIALIAPSLSSLKQIMRICENFAKSHNIVFNSSKTKLLCYNKDPQTVIPPIYLNREQVSVVEHEKHLGNFCQLTFTIEILSVMYVIFIKE